jgi:hypothetical protein
LAMLFRVFLIMMVISKELLPLTLMLYLLM